MYDGMFAKRKSIVSGRKLEKITLLRLFIVFKVLKVFARWLSEPNPTRVLQLNCQLKFIASRSSRFIRKRLSSFAIT